MQIWTIRYSNRSIQTFITLLKEHDIEVIADIRRFPTSKIQHFKREQLEKWLPENSVEYVWLGKQLGGYRKGGYKRHASCAWKQTRSIAIADSYRHFWKGKAWKLST